MRILQCLLASLFIHLLLVIFLQKIPASLYDKAPEKVEVEIVQNKVSQNEKAHQIVRASLIPESYKVTANQDPLRFLSDKVQKVKEQTRAALNGLTQNRTSSLPASKNSQKVDPFGTHYTPRLKQQMGSESGFSTISESIDDVKVGNITALNTDQYLFYSFFNRVNELVYFRWATLVRDSQERVGLRMYNRSNNDKWLTQIEIWVKPNGEFHSAHIMKESGIVEFDRAAVLAFRQAGLFPNPPKELVEEDGLIHLKYGLTVFFDPKVVVSR